MLHLVLFSLFCDHMVLQENRANPIWGWDRPGQQITVEVEEGRGSVATIRATAGADGSWRTELPALAAGGPYRLRVEGGGEARVVDDVLVGEVWLASGQSNMEWPLVNTDGADGEIARGTSPEIREFKVRRAAAGAPASRVEGGWTVCSPAAAGDFSAVAYYFAKELHSRLRVPIGIVNASWGGTRIEAWAGVPALRAAYDVDAELARLAALEPEMPRLKEAYERRLRAWEDSQFAHDAGIARSAAGWAAPGPEGDAWKPLRVPGYWQRSGLAFNGAAWFRTHLEIPASWAGRDLALDLGPIDDFDTTFFNGVQVGLTPPGTPGSYLLPRHYRVPGRLVKPGPATLAVRVFDQGGEGGFGGTGADMALSPVGGGGAPIPLAGTWRYRFERPIPLIAIDWTSYPAPDYLVEQDRPGWLFNGMIAPLIPYGIRGAIWYQGENNAAAPMHYREKFAALIRDWRTRWGEGQFPFDFVQLADFRANSGWPRLREQQALALAEPLTGMAVTIDIGDPANIHPRNKREVGRRLALLARTQVYGERGLEASGPVLRRVEIAGNRARIFWDHGEGLRTRGGGAQVRGFEVAGADEKFAAATARIAEDGSVVASAAGVPAPVAVRYDFEDCPDGNLENSAGLPAAPFRTDGF